MVLWDALFSRELCPPTHFSLAGCAILSAPAVSGSTRISAGLKHVQGHSSRVNIQREGPVYCSKLPVLIVHFSPKLVFNILLVFLGIVLGASRCIVGDAGSGRREWGAEQRYAEMGQGR